VKPCADSIDLSTLVAYWTGELGDGEARFEEHFFACASCTARLRTLAALGDGIAELLQSGRVFASLTQGVLDRAAARGLRIRSYRLGPDESVACTIAPDDDVNVIRLAADFTGIDGVDLDVYSVEADRETRTERLRDLVVDRGSDELVLLYPGEAIRPLPRTTFRLELSASGAGDPRRLGTYTLHHSPWSEE